MNWSRCGCALSPGMTGCHREYGASVDSMATLRGPVRRSESGAIDFRQLPAACSRSLAVICRFTSFSASAKVAADTAGPNSGAVPKAGGAPGGGCAGPFCVEDSFGFWAWLAHAAAPSNPRDACVKNFLRDSDDLDIGSPRET